MVQNGHAFEWRAMHTQCFKMIKAMACKMPILKPIDPRNPDMIWVICDASTYGVGAMYGQGLTWLTCRPAGFMSKKFSNAQHNYRTFEQETIAILEALSKWSDKLIGHKISVVTDHKSLEFFETQKNLSPCQTCWIEFLSKYDMKVHDPAGTEYANIDILLDPEGEDLSPAQITEIRAMQLCPQELREQVPPRDTEAADLDCRACTSPLPTSASQATVNDPHVVTALTDGPPLCERVEGNSDWTSLIKDRYTNDLFFGKVLSNMDSHPSFTLQDGLIWSKTRTGSEVLCIPEAVLNGRSIREIILDTAHTTIGHFGMQKTSEYVHQ
ncbi:hypothetical protein EWM64_g10260, partial [Hericium alpestre]